MKLYGFVTILVFILSCKDDVTKPNNENIDPIEIPNLLIKNPIYDSWAKYWSHVLVDVDFNNLQLKIIRNDSISSEKIDVNSYFAKRSMRSFSLSYSSKKDYIFDSYDDKEFMIENDTLKYLGGDVDPSISILSLNDSLYTYHTNGPTSFYDEGVWLSAKVVVALGFSFMPSSIEEESGLWIFITVYDLQKRMKIDYVSQRFELSENLHRLNSSGYFKYKYQYLYFK